MMPTTKTTPKAAAPPEEMDDEPDESESEPELEPEPVLEEAPGQQEESLGSQQLPFVTTSLIVVVHQPQQVFSWEPPVDLQGFSWVWLLQSP